MVIGTTEVYRLLALMLNVILLKFMVKKNMASPDKDGYDLFDNETYLYFPCMVQTFFLLYFSGFLFCVFIFFCFLLLERVGKELRVKCL